LLDDFLYISTNKENVANFVTFMFEQKNTNEEKCVTNFNLSISDKTINNIDIGEQ
jgi:hypothetical protein